MAERTLGRCVTDLITIDGRGAKEKGESLIFLLNEIVRDPSIFSGIQMLVEMQVNWRAQKEK